MRIVDLSRELHLARRATLDILAIEGDSYRLKEAQERAEQRARQRRKAKS